jgi:hypothetical protein
LAFGARTAVIAIAALAAEASAAATATTAAAAIATIATAIAAELTTAAGALGAFVAGIGVLEVGITRATAFAAIAATIAATTATTTVVATFAAALAVAARFAVAGGRGRRFGFLAEEALEPTEETAGLFLGSGRLGAGGAIRTVVARLIGLIRAGLVFAIFAARFARGKGLGFAGLGGAGRG